MSLKITFIILLVGLVAVQTVNAQGLFAWLAALLQPKPQAVKVCGVLKDGKQYYVKSTDGRYAVFDGNNLAFMRQVPQLGASRFTAVEKGCNVYGFSVQGKFTSRCHTCASDSGDIDTVTFHNNNADGEYSQWTIYSLGGISKPPYNLRPDIANYMRYKRTSLGDDQLTLASTITKESGFDFVPVDVDCGLLENGVEYWIITQDGMVSLDENNQYAYINRNTTAATRFTAVQVQGCNVYRFCVGGYCMGRCGNCFPDSGDYQTIKFHITEAEAASEYTYLTEWILDYDGTPEAPGAFRVRLDDPVLYWYYKKTPNGKTQLTLLDGYTMKSHFAIVPAHD